MKAIEIYRSALILCGNDVNEEYVLGEENSDKLYFVNRALMDLRKETVSDISSEIYANTKTTDAIILGVAFYLAVKYCKNDIATFLSELYNSKRAIALGGINRVKNSLFYRQ